MAVREDLGPRLEDEARQVDGLTGGAVGWSAGEDLDREARRELDCGNWSWCCLLRGQTGREETSECEDGDKSEQRSWQQSVSHRSSFQAL
jgi:hypothetical protein